MTIDGGGSAFSAAPHLAPVEDATALPYASWFQRVVATLLDQGLLVGAAFLLFPVQPVDPPTILLGGTPGEVGGLWTDSAWYVALVVVMVLMQSYLGATPGKLAVGIAMVNDRDLRPAGLLRTVLREVAHIIDAVFFMIGYLRPLWHRERRTFADSIAATVVLRTTRPLPYTVTRTTADGVPSVWERVSRPVWMRNLVWASTAACAVGVAYAIGPVSATGGGGSFASCTVDVPVPDSLAHGTVAVRPEVQRMTRFGVERQLVTGGDPGIEVSWQIDGTYPSEATLRLRLVSTDTGVTRTVDHQVVAGRVLAGRGEPVDNGDLGVLLPLSVADGLGDDWTWQLTTVQDGVESAPCTAD